MNITMNNTMKKCSKIAIVMIGAVSLAACEPGSKEGGGTFIGALAGAALGATIAGKGDSSGKAFGIVAGGLAGAAIGNSIGKSLDRADRLAMQQARYNAVEYTPSGETVRWHNPDSGNAGTYTPRPAQQDRAGRYCREFQQTVTIGGKTEEAYGKACRMPDGDWQIVNS